MVALNRKCIERADRFHFKNHFVQLVHLNINSLNDNENKIRIFVVHIALQQQNVLFSSFFVLLYSFCFHSNEMRVNRRKVNIQAKPIRFQLASVAGNIWLFEQLQNQYITVLLLNVNFLYVTTMMVRCAPRRKYSQRIYCLTENNLFSLFGSKI